MKLYFSLFLFLLLFAEYISYHVFTYNLKVLTVFLFIYTVSMGVCVCVDSQTCEDQTTVGMHVPRD